MQQLTFTVAAVALLALGATAFVPNVPNVQIGTYGMEDQLSYTVSNGNQYTYTLGPLANGSNVAVRIRRSQANVQGWDYISFSADQDLMAADPKQAFYAVGYAEGYLTCDGMYSNYRNAVQNAGLIDGIASSTCFASWFESHKTYMRNIDLTNTSEYAKQVSRQMSFMDGLYEGYNACVPRLPQPPTDGINATLLSWDEVFYISFQTEIQRVLDACVGTHSQQQLTAILDEFPNLQEFIKPAQQPSSSNNAASGYRAQHCSAFVKITQDDIFMGHDTWSDYNTMVRQYKTYEGLGATVTMSSYPGSLSSIDDWYMTSHNLTVTETSIGNYNNSLNKFVVPDTVSEFMRVMVANFLSTSAAEWVKNFADHNSGTYNNQYMVLDNALASTAFTADGAYPILPAGTFFVLEQLPGLMFGKDMTDVLNTQRYWSSFNIPYFPEVYNMSGYLQQYQMYGDFFSLTNYSRARIFARQNATVVDAASMFALMQFNEYQTDEFSIIPWCTAGGGNQPCPVDRSADLSIAARSDLAPLANEIGGDSTQKSFVDRGLFGAIDTKFTSMKWMQQGLFGVALSGPTTSGGTLPPFNWATFQDNNAGNNSALWNTTVRRGVPDLWDNAPVFFTGDLVTVAPGPLPSPKDDDDDSKKKVAIGVGVAAGVAVTGVIGFLAYRHIFSTRIPNAEGEDRPLV